MGSYDPMMKTVRLPYFVGIKPCIPLKTTQEQKQEYQQSFGDSVLIHQYIFDDPCLTPLQA